MTEIPANTKEISAQNLENLLKEGKTDQFLTAAQEVYSGDLQTSFYTMRDLAKLNKADMKNNPDLPGITLYGYPDSQGSIAGIDMSTPGSIFGNFWRNHTDIGIAGNGTEAEDPEKVRPPDLWLSKPPTAQDLNNILKTGDIEKFQNTIDEQLVPRGRHEETLGILKEVERLNATDRVKNKNLPVFAIKPINDNLDQIDVTAPNSKGEIKGYSGTI